ncbi:phosphoenolpyruvate--protein phosphotransferase [Bradyrhizobium sp. GCM10027634]|uniref:phosphoenolpyruvate--protein phosphotransferase n=1 Tax=unclassified Bradyrhizobium TaxID=2631580 RepID=UPI00263AE6D9|nr:phosphoenolpyruvate--protein phosphotransferase [Bradyrhizobium sp. WYCCWR 12677]MDN5001376.1 phosphoenolpyruvate--protein phosphotransferase [Bradyrhizobium sp. WYCCWR 12677]
MQGSATGLAYRGRTASIGFARGPLVRVDASTTCERVAGTLVEEALALRKAIDLASGQIAELAAIAGGEAAQILEFQVALLEDQDLIEAIFSSIGEGNGADVAWCSALDAQIADYNSAEDEYLKARSSDLADLRDRVIANLRGGEGRGPEIPGGSVVCADDLPPSRFLEIDWSAGGGLALLRGSPTSHVAMLARARGIPMVVQLGAIPQVGATALLDGEGATLELDPSAEQLRLFEQRREIHRKSRASARAILRRPTASWRGERIKLLINIQRVEDLDHADAQYADGIGLMRTEFLLAERGGLPDEETQYRAYDAVLRWADRRPVTIRTFDAGGDKPVPGFTIDGEANPFLGVRGLRLCLARPEIFTVQLRALARAAVHGNLRVMFPMVTAPDELEAGRKLFADIVQSLQAERIAAMLPELGIMVEVPAAALAIATFKAAFFSIGSNDLAQYVLACDRSNGALAPLMDSLHPAVLELIARTAEHGRRTGTSVSLCGDMAGEERCLPALLNCGLRELSVNASSLAQIKHTIDRLSSGGGLG